MPESHFMSPTLASKSKAMRKNQISPRRSEAVPLSGPDFNRTGRKQAWQVSEFAHSVTTRMVQRTVAQSTSRVKQQTGVMIEDPILPDFATWFRETQASSSLDSSYYRTEAKHVVGEPQKSEEASKLPTASRCVGVPPILCANTARSYPSHATPIL
jgi:hypothetical protein